MRSKPLCSATVLACVLLLLAVAAALAVGSNHMPLLPAANEPVESTAATVSPRHLLQQGAANSPATFVRAALGGVDSLDPHWQYDTRSPEVIQQVYEPLIFYDREAVNEFVPLLAITMPEISPDHTVYTFTVRQGVQFHEGGSLTASDVAYSFWRWMLQGRSGGSSWIILDTMLGVSDVDGLPGTDGEKCQAVKDSVRFDNDNWTVSFHLTRAFNPLLDVLASPFSSILDQEWMADNGGWGGDCSDWRSYHNPGHDDSILWNQMNGTGPFKFQNWTGDELTLVRNNSYWREEPIWDGGPTGLAGLLQIVFKYEGDAATRLDLLDTGEADSADVPSEYYTAANALVRDEYDGGEIDPGKLTVLHSDGILRSFKNLPGLSASDAIFIYDIASDDNPYIGSGTLDGDGIPTNFFTDTHVRKAFNYCFDWDTFIAEAYLGEAEQRRGPIVRGVMGYSDAQEVYTHSLTLCEDEFQLAWAGDVWTEGFSMTIAYNAGNEQRQKAAEIIKENVESITDSFHIEIVALDYLTEYLPAIGNRELPIYFSGWGQDYHHPHNWVVPYMHSEGLFASNQGFPQGMRDEFDDRIEECLGLVGTEAEACYQDLQDMAHDYAIDIFLTQPVNRHYEHLGVNGYYNNPAYMGPYYFYAISEGERSYVPLTLKRYQ
ncbi:MAG: ABC transporter substrate-binding protein [Anaerolineae bacterium]|nr:ABC transporter substrate-binding protein [Anaerolineae bacterium]